MGRNLPSAEPALPVEVLLLGDLPGISPRAHRGPCSNRRVELLGAGCRRVHDDPRATRVGLGPSAEVPLEPEQDLGRIAGCLDSVVVASAVESTSEPSRGPQSAAAEAL